MAATKSAEPRSTFVTALAWVFIALSGFATLVTLLQNVMVWTIFSSGEVRAAMDQAPSAGGEASWILDWMVRHFHLVFLVFFLACLATLVASLGLLGRREWARVLFITIMGIGILWNVAGLALGFLMATGMLGEPWASPAAGDEQFKTMMYVMMGFNVLFVGAFVALFAWIVRRLSSAEIRREFRAA